MPYPKGPVSAPHGKSIKCPNVYEALRRQGKSKKNAAQISNAMRYRTSKKGNKYKCH